MKKNYQRPQTMVVNISLLPMLNGSPTVGIDYTADPFDPSKIDSRRRNLWDDDDEDFE